MTHTHFVVHDAPLPNLSVYAGRMFNPAEKPVEPVVRLEEDVEVKVVRKRGRRPAKANEAAETK